MHWACVASDNPGRAPTDRHEPAAVSENAPSPRLSKATGSGRQPVSQSVVQTNAEKPLPSWLHPYFRKKDPSLAWMQ
jgi:hypothetical protein